MKDFRGHTYHKLPEKKVGFARLLRRVKCLLSLLYPQVQPYRRLIIGNWLVMIILSAVSAAPILLARKIVEDFQAQTNQLLWSLILLASIIIIISVFKFLCTISLGAINYRIQHALEIKYTAKMIETPLSYYDSNSSGSVSITPFLQLPLLTRVVEILLGNFIQAVCTIIAILAALFYLNLSVGVISIGFVPIFFLGAIYAGKEIERNVKRSFAHMAGMHSHLLESLVSIKSIRTLGISGRRVAQIESIAKNTLRAQVKTLIATGITRLGVEIVFAAGIVAIILILRYYYIEGSVTLGLCAAVLTGFGMLAREIRKLNHGVVELRRIVGATTQVSETLLRPSEHIKGNVNQPPTQVNSITMEAVTFFYKKEHIVLDRINMAFFSGCITAIVGESGAGKSTLADLLLRLRRPCMGKIIINDNTPLAILDEAWLRKTIAFVDQEPFLFNMTIRENLLLSVPQLSDEQLYDFLAAAGADKFVKALPARLDTPVGEGGGLVSVGEKQRLALARALTTKPTILVLDEVTSALDQNNEATIMETLRHLATQMIIILITHKKSVAARCDRIYRIQNAKAELIKRADSFDFTKD